VARPRSSRSRGVRERSLGLLGGGSGWFGGGFFCRRSFIFASASKLRAVLNNVSASSSSASRDLSRNFLAFARSASGLKRGFKFGCLSCFIDYGLERAIGIIVLHDSLFNGIRYLAAFMHENVGVRDFAFVREKTGPMAEPLKDPAYFARVFIEDGAPTWLNGYDWDPIALHGEMKAAGLLRRAAAAE